MANKGGPYEREVCKMLSLWLSRGKSDDWLWRSSQSGGRATIRSRKGKSTTGHESDIAATCPQGMIFTKLVSVEIKRGYNSKPNNTLYHLLDLWRATPPKIITVKEFMQQARAAKKRSGAKYWAVIHRLDNREAVIYSTERMFQFFHCTDGIRMTYQVPRKQTLVIMQLDDFLEHATPPNRRK